MLDKISVMKLTAVLQLEKNQLEKQQTNKKQTNKTT
jgi:hypothetical protein